MERGRGRHRPTKSRRRKWVEEDMTTKYVDTIKEPDEAMVIDRVISNEDTTDDA